MYFTSITEVVTLYLKVKFLQINTINYDFSLNVYT